MQEVIPFLAEAAPEAFVAALSSFIDDHVEDSSEGVSGFSGDADALRQAGQASALVTNRASWNKRRLISLLTANGEMLLGQLCRALETLAWDMDFLKPAALLLARLGSILPPPDDKSRELAPIQSLHGIFAPVMPQTCGPIDERLSVLETLCHKVPNVAWQLLLALLSAVGGPVHMARKPWVPFLSLPPSRGLAYEGEGYGQIETFLTLACQMAASDGSRWAELLDRLPWLPDGLDTKLLRTLRQVAGSVDDRAGKVWGQLDLQRQWYQDQIDAQHRNTDRDASIGSTAKHHADRNKENHRAARSRDGDPRQRLIVQLINPLIAALAPNDPFVRLSWMFQADARRRFSLEDEGFTALLEKRQKALLEIHHRDDCWTMLARIAANSDDPQSLAHSLAENPLAPALAERLQPPADFSPFEKIASRFLALWLLKRPFGELEAILRTLVEVNRIDDAAKIICQYGFTDRETHLWDLLDDMGEPLLGAYWRGIEQFFPAAQRDPSQHLRAIRRLLQYQRLNLAIVAAYRAKPPLPTDELFEVLEKVASQSWQTEQEWRAEQEKQLPSGALEAWDRRRSHRQQTKVDQFTLGQLIRLLNPIGQEEQQRAFGLELSLVRLLAPHKHQLRFVPGYLTEHPQHFVQLVHHCADPTSRSDLPLVDRGVLDDLLRMWPGFPGSTLAPPAADKFLLDWCHHVIAQLPESLSSADVRKRGLNYLARLLVRPSGSDGIWPCVAVRQLLQEEPDLADILYWTKLNARGVVMRDSGEGGEQEHALARRFADSAALVSGQLAATKRLLLRLADAYEHQARQEDERATIHRWRYDMPASRPLLRPLFPLTRVRIAQFRAIAELNLEPHKRLTLLFGKNASGKSSVLDAISVGLSTIGQLLPHLDEGAPGWQRFAPKDLHKHTEGGEKVPARQQEVHLWGQPLDERSEAPHWQVVDRYAGRSPQILDRMSPDLEPYLEQVSEALRKRDRSVAMPVFAHYGVERAVSERAKADARPPSGDQPREVGLWGALVSTARFEWAVGQFRLLQEIERDEREKLRNFDYQLPKLQAVREAITATLKTPDGARCENPRIEPRINKLVVNYVPVEGDAQELEIGQLSDGFRTHLALVMDLALRMVICNPPPEEAGAVSPDGFGTKSYAVVLLDEIDLHLHPSWQHTALRGLLDAFPNTQFFVTTHSEQVLSSVDGSAEALVLMLEQVNGQVRASAPDRPTYGARGQDILKMMGVSERPSVEITEDLAAYLSLIDQGQGETERALELRKKLDQKLYPRDAALLGADIEMRRQEGIARRANKQ